MTTGQPAADSKRRIRIHRRRGSGRGGAQDPPAFRAMVPPGVLTACSSAVRRLGDDTVTAVGITSTRRREGRSTVALGIALVMRERLAGTTVLIELDFERPCLAELLGLPAAPGLAQVLREEADLEDSIRWVDPSFGVLPAGDVAGVDSALWSQFGPSGVLGKLAGSGHRVVADLPPLPPYGQADRLADLFSATILVVRAGRTSAEEIDSAVRALTSPPAVILNGKSSAVPGWLRALGL